MVLELALDQVLPTKNDPHAQKDDVQDGVKKKTQPRQSRRHFQAGSFFFERTVPGASLVRRCVGILLPVLAMPLNCPVHQNMDGATVSASDVTLTDSPHRNEGWRRGSLCPYREHLYPIRPLPSNFERQTEEPGTITGNSSLHQSTRSSLMSGVVPIRNVSSACRVRNREFRFSGWGRSLTELCKLESTIARTSTSMR